MSKRAVVAHKLSVKSMMFEKNHHHYIDPRLLRSMKYVKVDVYFAYLVAYNYI